MNTTHLQKSPKVFLLILGTILAVAWLQLPRLVDTYKVDEDFRTFYWMNKFQESDLFPNDQLRGPMC